MAETPNIGLKLAAAPDVIDYETHFNGNWNKIDEELTKQIKKTDSVLSILEYKNLVVDEGLPTENWSIAIQKAIDDTLLAGGGTVLVPTGRRRVTTSLAIGSNVSLVGLGESSEIYSDVPNLNLIVSSINAEYCSVKDLKITGSGFGTQPSNTAGNPNVDGAGCGIVFRGVKYGLIENCILDNHGGNGTSSDKNGVAAVWLTYGCQDVIVSQNHIANSRNGINEDNYYGAEPYNNLIKDNFVKSCRFGIVSDNGKNAKGCKIINNTVKDCLYSGIDINKSNHVLIQGNWIEGNGISANSAGILIYGSPSVSLEYVQVYDNTCIGNYGQNIKVAVNTYHVKVHNNLCMSSVNGSGIFVQACRDISVVGNTCAGNMYEGIYIVEGMVGSTEITPTRIIVESNLVKSNGTYGVLASKAIHCHIKGNVIAGNGTNGTATKIRGVQLSNGCTYNVIEGNIVTGSSEYSILGSDGATQYNVVSNNVCRDGAIGIYFSSAVQYFSPNGDNRVQRGAVMTDTVDLKTNNAPLQLKTTAGTPTGTLQSEIVVDSTASKLWINVAGTWKSVTLA